MTEIHGCTAAAYTDRSGAQDDRTIGFGGTNASPALGFSPKCLTVAAGQSVIFKGSFSTHPLRSGEYMGTRGSTPNPVPSQSTGNADLTVAFPTAGLYPYLCESHVPAMVGVIQVK
ncbi:MAG: cupredoxin domain-containing protein [Myxococcaceae bacterium]